MKNIDKISFPLQCFKVFPNWILILDEKKKKKKATVSPEYIKADFEHNCQSFKKKRK